MTSQFILRYHLKSSTFLAEVIKPWLHLRLSLFALSFQLDIINTVLRQKSKMVARVDSCLQCLQHVEESQYDEYSSTVISTILLQNLPLATCVTFWLHSPCNTRKKYFDTCVSKNAPYMATA